MAVEIADIDCEMMQMKWKEKQLSVAWKDWILRPFLQILVVEKTVAATCGAASVIPQLYIILFHLYTMIPLFLKRET